MSTATINYDQSTAHWPPESFHVQLDPPLKRFDPHDGKPILYDWIMVTCKHSRHYGAGQDCVEVFPTDEAGNFVQDYMIPLSKYDYGQVHSVLKAMGYEVAN